MSANLQACSFLLGRLEGEVAKLRSLDFPGHHIGPRKWLNFITGLLDTAKSYLEAAQAPGVDPQAARNQIVDAERLGDNAYQLLTFVAGADSTQIPHQVVAPFQRWVDALGIKETTFFRAEHLPNYELASYDLRCYGLLNGASQALIDATADITWPALRVSVPGNAMGLLPHFAVVAHELGHAIEKHITPDLTAFQQPTDDAVRRAMSRLEKDGVSFSAEHALQAGKIIKSWIEELKADAVGHWMVGPGFFFALCGFLELSAQGYGMGVTHPPSDLRREILFKKLSEGTPSYVDVLHAKTGLAITEDFNSPNISRRLSDDEMYKELGDSIGKVDAALCVELVPIFANFAPAIFQAALDRLSATSPELIYTPARFDEDLDRHLELLCNLVPPIEFTDAGIVRPASLSSIINVGWAALLTRVDRFPVMRGFAASMPVAARMESLHELLLKAVELAEARQLWEEAI